MLVDFGVLGCIAVLFWMNHGHRKRIEELENLIQVSANAGANMSPLSDEEYNEKLMSSLRTVVTRRGRDG